MKCLLHSEPRPHLCDDCARQPADALTVIRMIEEDRGRMFLGKDEHGRPTFHLINGRLHEGRADIFWD